MLPVSIYLCVSCSQCYPCLSFCVLCPLLSVFIFLCLGPNVSRVYLSVGTRHRKIGTGNIGQKTKKYRHGNIEHKTQKDRHVSRVYLSVYCAQCYTSLSFCVLCPMFPLTIFLCIVPNATRLYLSVSCAQCSPCLHFFVFCPMLPVSIFEKKGRHG
jgi:hypothetical protein